MNETEARQQSLLRDAAAWRLLGMLLECPNKDWRAQTQALACEIDDAELQSAATNAQTEASEGLYHSIFGPGGPAPPREVSYRDWTQPGYLLSELTEYYRAFGWQPALAEAPDHVAVEAGFVSYLRLKEAYALACADNEHAVVTAEAAQHFITEHLQTLGEPLAKSLEHSGVDYLAKTGASLLRRVGPRPVRPTLTALPVLNENEENAFSCGEL
jgi:nitrate reductase assembly molybdenum cofactor insertion protein NarJ